jgi:hypothetical protein
MNWMPNKAVHRTRLRRVGDLTSEVIRQGVEGGFLGVTYSTSVQEILRSEMPQDAF